MLTVSWPGQPGIGVARIDYWSCAVILHLSDGRAVPIRLSEQEVRRIYDGTARGDLRTLELTFDPLPAPVVH